MMNFYEGQDALFQQLNSIVDIEKIPLPEANGRILAVPIDAQYDSPSFDNSAMDGFAICDLECESWHIVGTVAAGDTTTYALQPGEAMRIFTGAAVPEHSDAVVMQENVSVNEHTLTINSSLELGENIRRCGEELTQGQVILSPGVLLTPEAIGLAASQGVRELLCYKRLRVTVFTTGDELVSQNNPLYQHQIFDSNRPMLIAMLKKYNFFEIIDGGTLPDKLEIISNNMIEAAQNSHAIVVSGGASMGDRDLVRPVLEKLGSVAQWQLAIKPGKPFGWGHIGSCQTVLLPGNPVASFVTFTLLGLPALQIMAGRHVFEALPECSQARAGFDLIPNRQRRREFLRGSLFFTPDGPKVVPLKKQGSHMLSSCVSASVLIDIPPQTDIHEGQWLTIYPL